MSHDLQHFRQRLLKQKQEASERLAAIRQDIRHENIPKDWEDRASETENDEALESLMLLTQRELTQIDAALARIGSGDYFTCSECGEAIPEQRLELLPFTTLCINCAELHEKQERLGLN